MTNINKVSAERSIAVTGAYGNSSQQTADFDSVGVLEVSDVFYAMKIAKNSVITDLKLTAVAGLSVATGTVDIGYIMGGVAEPDYFAADFDTVTGGQKVSAAMPLPCTDDCYIIVTAKTAVTVANKRMAIVAGFEYKGEL